MASTARISSQSNAIISELMLQTGKTKIEIIEEALRSYLYHKRMELLNEQYERLRSDEKAWNDELQERRDLEGTLMDGLDA